MILNKTCKFAADVVYFNRIKGKLNSLTIAWNFNGFSTCHADHMCTSLCSHVVILLYLSSTQVALSENFENDYEYRQWPTEWKDKGKPKVVQKMFCRTIFEWKMCEPIFLKLSFLGCTVMSHKILRLAHKYHIRVIKGIIWTAYPPIHEPQCSFFLQQFNFFRSIFLTLLPGLCGLSIGWRSITFVFWRLGTRGSGHPQQMSATCAGACCCSVSEEIDRRNKRHHRNAGC